MGIRRVGLLVTRVGYADMAQMRTGMSRLGSWAWLSREVRC